jgi:hypothetical protein
MRMGGGMGMQPSIILLKEGTDTSQGKAQLISNINACASVADIVRTTLGPRGMDKLIHSNGKVGNQPQPRARPRGWPRRGACAEKAAAGEGGGGGRPRLHMRMPRQARPPARLSLCARARIARLAAAAVQG